MFSWYKKYADRRNIIGKVRGGGTQKSASSEVNVNIIAVAIEEGRHLSTRQLEAILYIPKSTIHHILTKDLHMRRMFSTWVLYMLTTTQLEQRIEACDENLGRIAEDPRFLTHVITCDRS